MCPRTRCLKLLVTVSAARLGWASAFKGREGARPLEAYEKLPILRIIALLSEEMLTSGTACC